MQSDLIDNIGELLQLSRQLDTKDNPQNSDHESDHDS